MTELLTSMNTKLKNIRTAAAGRMDESGRNIKEKDPAAL